MPISPSFPFFPSDYQGDPHTIVMTTEENGAYCLLMWVCWELEGLPNDLDELAGYARLPLKRFSPMWEKRIKRCFIFDEKRNLFLHPRFEKIIRELKAFRKQKSKAGKVSGQKRRERKELDAEQVFDSVPVLFEQTANKNEPSYSFSSSSSITKEEKEEKREEVIVVEPTRNDFGPPQNVPTKESLFSHPVIEALRIVTKRCPPIETRQILINKVEGVIDLPKLQIAFGEWRAKGFKDTNFDGILDWYLGNKNGSNKGTNGNGYHKRTDADVLAESAEFYKNYSG